MDLYRKMLQGDLTITARDRKFRRRTGVYPKTFAKMIEILEVAHEKKKMRGGRLNKLSIEKMLLMALEYWREYRTYFHISEKLWFV